MMLTLRRIFLGLNGLAINGKELNIKIVPEFNNAGQPCATRWYLSGTQLDEETCIKDYLAGIHIDEPENDVQIKFFDASNKYARFITDRTATTNVVPKRKKKTQKSAFKMLLEIINEVINDIDDEILDILLDERITRGKCKIVYPLLKEIPDDVQTEEELLANFYSLARPGEKVVRYWKKILIINGRRFWISNHIFKINILPFKELMSDLTGIELVNFNPLNDNNEEIDNKFIYAEALKKEVLSLFNKFQQGQITLEQYLESVKLISNNYSIDNYEDSFKDTDNNIDNEKDNIENENDIDIENDIESKNDDTENNQINIELDSNNVTSVEDLMKQSFGFI